MSVFHQIFGLLIQILTFLVFARFILSWIDMQQRWSITHLVYEFTEPMLGPIRQIMPNMGGLDLSPMVALLLLQLIGRAF